MKVHTQTEDKCRRTISYLKGYSCPKLHLQEIERSETYGEYSLQCKKDNFMLNAGHDKITSIYQSYCVFSLLFSQKISTKHDITSTEICYQFSALKFPVSRRNKATNSSTSTDRFSAATKTLVLGNLFKFERFPMTHSHGHFAIGDNEKNKTIVIFSSSLSPSGKLPRRMWCQV